MKDKILNLLYRALLSLGILNFCLVFWHLANFEFLMAAISLIASIMIWGNYCSEKALNQRSKLRNYYLERIIQSHAPFNLDLGRSLTNTSINKHIFYLMTFRNPWKLYSIKSDKY